MQKPAIPDNEPARLGAVRELGIMYTAAEERFDRITRMASKLLDAPIALVTLVDERCQWFKSSQGLAATETPREVSFCGHAILTEETFVVEDATKDQRFTDNPLVTGDPNIRFYAGHPLRTADGLAVGTLCIIGNQARTFAVAERAMLRDLAALVETELQREQLDVRQHTWLVERDELVQKASVDPLTRAWNRGTIMELLDGELSRMKRGNSLAVAMIDIDHFKKVNDAYGHPTGDRVLAQTATCIRAAVRDFDMVGRYGGEEFIVVLGNCPLREAMTVCERIRRKVSELAIISPMDNAIPVTVSVGVAAYSSPGTTAQALIDAADKALYRAKEAGRNRVEFGALAEA